MRLHAFFGGPPPFDLSTLPLSLYLRSEDLNITHPSGVQTTVSWPSHSSIGTSGDGREVFISGAAIAGLDAGISLGAAKPSLFINRPVNNSLPIYTNSGHGTTIIDTNVITTTACSMWALVNITSITGGAGNFADQQIMGVKQPRFAMLVGGSGNNKAETETEFSTITQATVSTGIWVVIQSRFDPLMNGIEVRVNQGFWATHAQAAISLFGEDFVIGAGGQGGSMNGNYGNLGAAKVRFDDATFDNIYSSLKLTYPSASLP